jgi:TolA-binding protein
MRRFLILILVVPFFAGCLKTRAELEAEETDRQQEKQTVKQQAPYKEKAPPTAYRFEEYDQQMREFSGKLEALEAQNTQLYNLMKAEREASAKDKQLQDQKVAALEEAVKKNESDIQAMNEQVAQLKAPPPAAALAPAPAGKAKSTYDEAEDLYNAKKWRDAIGIYQKYREKNPKGKYYADATLKIGMCFQELKMKDEAKTFFDVVAEKFPKSKESKKAALRMKTLK